MRLIAPRHHASLEERRARGRALRKRVPRQTQGAWQPDPGRADPVETIERAEQGRLTALLPIKHGRMAASPFGFFRGAAPIMAADLATLPVTGLAVQICGDAHVRNLGAFAAPDGHLVFDIDDFDETTRGPWEWDLKRDQLLRTTSASCAPGAVAERAYALPLAISISTPITSRPSDSNRARPARTSSRTARRLGSGSVR